MKKYFIMIAIVVVLLFSLSLAAEAKTLTFEWEQATEDIQSGVFGGWNLWGRTAPDAEWALISNILFVDEQATYTGQGPIISPENTLTNWEFCMTAYYTTGAESAYSEIVTYADDTRIPGMVLNFKLVLVGE